MNRKAYLAALEKLGLTPASMSTAEALGVTLRQCQRYAAGEPIRQTVVLLLQQYLEHGLPAPYARITKTAAYPKKARDGRPL